MDLSSLISNNMSFNVGKMDLSSLNATNTAGLSSAMGGLDNLCQSMLADTMATNSTSAMSAMGSFDFSNIGDMQLGDFGNLGQMGGTSTSMSVDALCNFLENNTIVMGDYMNGSDGTATIDSLKKTFGGLNEDSSVEDYTKAWMKAQFPEKSDAEIQSIVDTYAPMTKELEEHYQKVYEENKDLIGEDGDGQSSEDVDIRDYYRRFLSEQHPEMSNEQVEELCESYAKQAEELEAKYEQIADESGLNEDSTLSDYFTFMIKQQFPDISDKDLQRLVKAYEKSSEPMVEYYNKLAEAFPELAQADEAARASGNFKHTGNKGVDGLMDEAYSMLGLNANRNAAQINRITKQSGIDCSTTAWCASWAMTLLKNHGVLDTSGCANVNYTPTITNWSKNEGTWRQGGGNYTPQPGDAIMFDWDGGRNDADHIGIVTSVKNGVVYTIEGNSSNSVAERSYNLSDGRIMGYIDCESQHRG